MLSIIFSSDDANNVQRLTHEFKSIGVKAVGFHHENFTTQHTGSGIFPFIRTSDGFKQVFANSIDFFLPFSKGGNQSNFISTLNGNLFGVASMSSDGAKYAETSDGIIAQLKRKQVQTPRYKVFSSMEDFYYIDTNFTAPYGVVVKSLDDSFPAILADYARFEEIAKDTIKRSKKVLVQEYVKSKERDASGYVTKTETKDYTAIFVGNKVVAAWQHDGLADTENFTKNVTLNDSLNYLASQAANAVGMQVAAVELGIDVVTGQNYVYSVESDFNLIEVENITNVNVSAEIANYASIKANENKKSYNAMKDSYNKKFDKAMMSRFEKIEFKNGNEIALDLTKFKSQGEKSFSGRTSTFKVEAKNREYKIGFSKIK